MDILDKDMKEAQSGGGMIGEITLYGAYVTFAQGVTPRDRTFLYANDKEKAAAKAKAEALGKPQQTLAMVQYKDSIIGRDITWQDDRFHTYGPPFGPDYKFMIEKKNELGIPVGKKVWARVSWMTSPNAEANQDQAWAWSEYQGEKRLKSMAFPVEIYASKADAVKAAESLASEAGEGASDPTYPGDHTGWSLEDWQGMKAEIVAKYQELASGIDGPAPVKAKKLDEAQKQVCGEYVITTLLGDPDVEKLRLLLAEAAV
jgi:hypothetical protein